MQHMTGIVGVAFLWASMSGAAEAADSWDVVVNGRSIHMNATHEWNEDNWGLGVEREFASERRWVKVALANAFTDSMGDLSYMAGGGIKRRFHVRSDDFYVDLGAIGFLMTRETVNRNQPFLGVLPAATFGFNRVALNLTYLPESVVDRVTSSSRHDPTMEGVFFLQLKLDTSLFGPRSTPRRASWLGNRQVATN
jgi:hypothetical protein